MANETEIEVFRAFRDSQTRYTYFLLAAAGAAIGLAVNLTQSEPLSQQHAALGIAVALWAGSFLAGLRQLAYFGSSLYANAALLNVQDGRHPDVGSHPELIAAASEGIREAIDGHSRAAAFFGRMQLWMLTTGAGAFIAWHVWEMYLLSD